MNAIFILLIVDYILTYIGIKVGLVEEANILMIWLFELPLLKGLLIRCIMSLFIIMPFFYLEKHCKYYKKVLVVVISGYIFIMFLHLRWIAII